MLNNILYRFSDGWDIVTLGQVTPTLYMLSEDRRLWKRLCQYHFAEKQVSGPLALLLCGFFLPPFSTSQPLTPDKREKRMERKGKRPLNKVWGGKGVTLLLDYFLLIGVSGSLG